MNVSDHTVRYADPDLHTADRMTSAAATVGVAGIGLGGWWTETAAAIVIAASILKDGITPLRAAVAVPLDARPTSVGKEGPAYVAGRDRRLPAVAGLGVHRRGAVAR